MGEAFDGYIEAEEASEQLLSAFATNPEQLSDAIGLALRAHHGQKRKSGEPYVTHPLNVGLILREWGMDHTSIVAGLLHDVVEDTAVTLQDIRDDFGYEIATLVDGLTKLDGVKLVESAAGVDALAAQNLQKLLLAVSEDPRVLVVKLADRLHNIRTLGALPKEKAARIARETMDVHAPLAQRLGMSSVAGELEDLCFAVLYPERCAELSRQIEQRLLGNRADIDEVREKIVHALSGHAVRADVSARFKNRWSVYEKMVVKHRSLDQIYDLAGVRVVVDSIPDCYSALGVVHVLFQPVPGRFKDWVAAPKLNMYQSLHTTVLTSEGMPVEVQIRTREMHQRAEWGVAAHWRYKSEDELPRDQIGLLRRLGEVATERTSGHDPSAFMEHVRAELGGDDLYCFTPKGDVVALPGGSTCVDFAYGVHTEIGHTCVGARVNGRLVPLATELSVGDRVEIITSRESIPKREWLSFVVSSRARSRIRQRVERQSSVETTVRVPDALSSALAELGVPQRVMRAGDLAAIAAERGCADVAELLERVERAEIDAEWLAHRLAGVAQSEEPADAPDAPDEAQKNYVAVEGLYGAHTRIAKCCKPVVGDRIVGFLVQRKTVEVHRDGCAGAVKPSASWRAVEVAWDGTGSEVVVEIHIDAIDREGLLADVCRTIADSHVAIVSSSTATGRDMIARERFRVRLADLWQLEGLLESLRHIDGVYTAERA
jgi:guanosine-3',5'-bis(diphosphate) 3'-pyrophosphohydrolase